MILQSRIKRALVLSVVVALSWGLGELSEAASLFNEGSSSVMGTWTGESICVGDRPACKNEVVVYRLEPVAGKPGLVTMLADKILDGKRVPMARLDFQYDEARDTLSCEFNVRRTHGLWEFKVMGDTMEGTLVVFPDKSLARRVKVKRVRDDQLPTAPNRKAYEGE